LTRIGRAPRNYLGGFVVRDKFRLCDEDLAERRLSLNSLKRLQEAAGGDTCPTNFKQDYSEDGDI
jgi:hypothetical protein